MKIHFCAISRHVSRRLQLGWCQYLFTRSVKTRWWGGSVDVAAFPPHPHPPLGKPKEATNREYDKREFWDILGITLNYETIHHLESRFGNNSFVLVESGPFTNRANLCAATVFAIYIFTGRRTIFCIYNLHNHRNLLTLHSDSSLKAAGNTPCTYIYIYRL